MSEVKLLEPQRLTDNPDGGGLATANEIQDGQINNLFADISRIDRVNGEVSLRKMFVKADTADTQTFSGLHVIVKQPPEDANVSCVLFQTPGWSDARSDAQELVERYLDESVITRWIPYDRQLAGQRALILFARPELPLPEIGEVYVLKNETVTPHTFEFIRVQDVKHSVQTFTDADGTDFQARVITLTLTQPLSREFPGSQPNRRFVSGTNASILRRTIVSDAARYYGVTKLAADAAPGALSLRVREVFSQLAPAATAEVAIMDAPAAETRMAVDAGELDVLWRMVRGWVTPLPPESFALGRGIKPGSVRIAFANGDPGNAHADFVDDGRGGFVALSEAGVHPGWSENWAAAMAVNYETGLITLASINTWASHTVDMRITAAISVSLPRPAITSQQRITQSTRGYVYTHACLPYPMPGSLSVSYRAAGKWYTLTDDGTGALTGPVGVGTGQVNFVTGDVMVSLSALPDIGSSILYAWGISAEFERRDGAIDITPPRIERTLSAGNVEPGSLSVSWFADGLQRTATDNGSGLLTGDATGRVVYGNGRVSLLPTLLPDANTQFVFTYQSGAVQTELFNPVKSGSTITMTVANGPIRPRSLLITYQQAWTANGVTGTTTQQLADNGAGELIDADGMVKAGSVVNYATGQISFNPDFTMVTPVLNYERFEQQLPARTTDPAMGYFAAAAQFGTWPTGCGSGVTGIGFANGTNVTVQYKQDGASNAPQSETVAMPPLAIDLTPGVVNTIVPGSVLFKLGGRAYVDRLGTLQYGIQPTGAGTNGGTINYQTGVATITSWAAGAAPALSVEGLLTEVRPLPVGHVTGRVLGAPIRPGSFFCRALRMDDGQQITATADVNGNISTAHMHGYVDINTGVFSVLFGRYALDSSLTADDKAEPWYDPANVAADGYIFRPREIIPGSLRFNAVVQTTLPLDPKIIGLNPVRLPIDGRVQTIRPGNTLVIHDTVTDPLAAGINAGAVRSLSRGNIASVVVYDQDGKRVPESLYTVDKAAGTLTFADPLDLSDYAQPLVCAQTIEDMALCTDAQITGDISIAQPLSRGYTAANSYVSSALVLGDAQARYQRLFAVNTWVGDWAATSGAAPTSGAKYDDLNHPLVVTNRDAITQRWRLQFTSATAFNVVAEQLGIVGTGTTGTGAAPINPATGQPYFVIAGGGFGSGWATGNAIRFDTIAAGGPVWLSRTVRPGPSVLTDDQTVVQARWDKD